MASSKWNKFGGIEQFHEGLPVSDFCNVIPMGDSCIDRLGEELVCELGDPWLPRGTFIDSAGNCYVVKEKKIYTFKRAGVGTITNPTQLKARNGEVFETLNPNSICTFCESSTKPSQVYMCDGKYIYWWNIGHNTTGVEWLDELTVNMLLSPNVYPKNEKYWQVGETFRGADYMQQFYNQADLYGQIKNGEGNYWKIVDIADITSITWFNNRLYATQSNKNTVWATCTDPAQFFRPTGDWISAPTSGSSNTGIPVFANPLFHGNDADTTDPNNDVQVSSALWVYWVSSTNGADRLNQAIACNGTMYFMNAKSIEAWVPSPDEYAPITPASIQTLGVGGRNAIVAMNRLVFIGENQTGSNFVGAIQDGALKILSTEELNHRIDFQRNPILYILRQRDDMFIGVNCYNNAKANNEWYMVDMEREMWWRWETDRHTEDFAIGTLSDEIGFTSNGNVMMFTDAKRTQIDGRPIVRSIRGAFSNFDGRKILRKVTAIMDTGKRLSGNSDDLVYCRVSFDRAHSFGGHYHRRLGENNHNDKMIEWRNLGSGNSIVIEIGTGADYKFQLYQIIIEIA